jgi:hypothetical protein
MPFGLRLGKAPWLLLIKDRVSLTFGKASN